MTEVRTTVDADYFQYYLEGAGSDFDASSVDMVNDGIVAPARGGARIATGVYLGPVEIVLDVIEADITVPSDPAIVAAAINIDLPTGVVQVHGWGGRCVFRHDFGTPLTCSALIEVHGRDEARERASRDAPEVREHHRITFSPTPLPGGRWRSDRIDDVGRHGETFTDHAGIDPSTRPPNLWFGAAQGPAVGPIYTTGSLPAPHKKLVDEIRALPEIAQRRLGGWAASEVSSRDPGRLPWSFAFEALRTGQPLPPPFDQPERLRHELPRAGIITGRIHPARATLEAILSLTDADPQSAALNALSWAAAAQPSAELFFESARHRLKSIADWPE
jgi:hypothetical protein